MIEVKVGTEKFKKWTDASVKRDIDNASCSFGLSSDEYRFKAGDEIKILVDGALWVEGFVDSVTGDSSYSGISYSYSGRDKVMDLLDSSLPDGVKNFKAGMDLVLIINKILKSIGLSVPVKNQAGSIKPFDYIELIAGDAGSSAFDLIQGYARKRGVMINSDGHGIKLFRINSGIVPVFNFTTKKGTEGTMLSSNMEIDISERFQKYVCKSQAQLEDEFSEATVFRKGDSEDKSIRNSRYYEFVAEESMTTKECRQRAIEEMNIRKARSLKYTIEVPGHSQNKMIYDIGYGARIDDEILGVSGTFLIKSVEFKESLSGETTSLVLTYPDAYAIDSSIIQKAEKKADISRYLAERDKEI